MKELKIKLNQKFKSFEANFNISLTGNLIILSGVNGSGKSQLLNIIYGQEGKDIQKKINSTILIDDQPIHINDIDIRSFKDNTYIPELTPSTPLSFINSGNTAWEIYRKNLLNPLSYDNYQFADSCFIARKILQEGYGEDKFNSIQISENDFKSKLLKENFIWRSGDKFTNSIGEIFFNHCLKVSEMMKEVSRANYNSSMLEKAPWTVLNELFTKLNLEYRFKDDYFINGVEINEQPRLFPLNIGGSINVDEGRVLSDLSDGEKTIISLCFASLIGNKFSEKKLLLLDELDSVLNPSLIEIFFTVIDDFFTKQGIMVVMSTHSSSTISLSPTHTKFYE
ncbi:MAG: AAA family ATPase, partial [Spirosoma sp.]|nr:AAA family ATPase [Spirosoma sp.]